MLTATEEKNLYYIEMKARSIIKGKSYFTTTDILEDAFLMSKDKAYDVLKNILGRKSIRNTPEAIVSEYIDMLKKGYGSIQEQVDVYCGDKMSTIEATARLRFKEFNGGSFLDLLREVYCVSEEDLMPLVAKFLQTIESQVFNYTLDKASFHNFLISDVKELDKQFDRFMNPDNN